MTTALAQRLLDRFGPEGVRRPGAAALAGLDLPADTGALIVAAGVPLQVGPYLAADPEDDWALGDHTRRHAPALAGYGEERWLRLGGDRGSELCVAPDGRVWSVFPASEETPVLVNTTVEAFLDGVADLYSTLGELAAARQPQEVFALFGRVESRLRSADLRAFESDESWWPRVLEDVRHTLGVPGRAAFTYRDQRGEEQVLTAAGSLALHPEEYIWQRLEASGVRPGDVLEVYTELQACFMPGHYCSLWMARTFPEASFTHSFDYGDSAREREAGVRALAAALTDEPHG